MIAVGNPFNLTSTVTAGIVSAKSRSIGILNGGTAIESFIQTDAAINPGNSGGALVNTNGDLIGINSAISFATVLLPPRAIPFAVPSNIVKKVVEDLREFGTVQRAFIGVNISDITPRLAQSRWSYDVVKGVYVGGVSEDGAAREAGIKTGDVMVSVRWPRCG
ncbi:MAG: trypsin-like peptidase domain-containing protein [Owenweeksia sp.]|nr:trypsin-like peptidase domain-containing protein [Owenweeksia sp.]